MSDFSQNRLKMTTFHILDQDRRHLRNQLRLRSKWKKTVIIIPLLASEYTDPENLPVLENILRQLREIRYLSAVIFGLDRADEAEAFMLRDLLRKHDIRNHLIQWNDGPGFRSIYEKLNDAGFNIREPGKGKNMFLSFGIAVAMGAEHPFDHKHQNVSKDDRSKGLNRMAVDVVTTLMNALVIEEGLEFSDTFFRDLSIMYRAVAEELIKKYSDDASFNNLKYDLIDVVEREKQRFA